MRSKSIFLSLVFCFFLLYHNLAQGAEWAKSYGGSEYDFAYSVQQTSDKGYILAGYTRSFGTGIEDIWVLKLDSNGNVVWQKTYGKSWWDDYAYSIKQTSDGEYIVAGRTNSFGNGYSDFWVLKLDANGNVVWQKIYGGADADGAYSIQQTSDGGYIVAGYTFSFGAGLSDIWVLKLDANGNVVWQKTYGGADREEATSIQQTKDDGGYIVAGYTSSFGAGDSDIWVLKLDSNGNVVWQKTYGGAYDDYAYSIQQTSDGGYILAGKTYSFGARNGDIWILKLDVNGNVVWQKTYGGDGANSIQQTSDGGYIVAGETWSFYWNDIWVLKLDANGNVVWQKTYSGESRDSARSIQQTSDGGYIVAGYTESFGAGYADIWVLKLDANGEIPNCGYMGTSDATVTTPTYSQTTPSISPSTTSVSGVNSNATINNTNVIPVELCYYNPPPVTVLRPNGGEHWNAGGNYTIKWDATSSAVKFKLFYSTDNKTSWTLIRGVGNVRQYKWTIPAQDGRKPKSFVKVVGLNSSNQKVGEDVSDKAFIIEVLKLTAPNGGETLTVGSTYTITWQTYALTRTVAKVILQYSTDGGSSWKGIKSFLSSNPGSYNWKVPNDPSTNCKVRVILKDSSEATIAVDASDKVFTIR